MKFPIWNFKNKCPNASLAFCSKQFFSQKYDLNKDYYRTLFLTKNASDQQIKDSFYKLAKLYHPDVSKGKEEKFKEINEAFNVLRDKDLRSEYNNEKFKETPKKSNSQFNNQRSYAKYTSDPSAYNNQYQYYQTRNQRSSYNQSQSQSDRYYNYSQYSAYIRHQQYQNYARNRSYSGSTYEEPNQNKEDEEYEKWLLMTKNPALSPYFSELLLFMFSSGSLFHHSSFEDIMFTIPQSKCIEKSVKINI